MTAASRLRGVFALRIAHSVTRLKNPESRKYAATIIIPKSSTSVCASTARTASFHGSTPVSTMSAPPMIATPVRSTRNPGTRPRPSAKYEAAKTASAIVRSSAVSPMPGIMPPPRRTPPARTSGRS
jgi:hypothetical protein